MLISPYAKVKEAVTINGHDYAVNDYVPTEQLNYLRGKESEDKATWEKVDYATGVTIRNAVFAGGNVSAGSDKVYANAKTVFGNATATLYDVYHRDLITIGTEHTGGLYGDGNLTFVDGYRELNITNYGTDYYGQSDNISIEEYHALNDRERAYFELKYKCVQDVTIGDKEYAAGSSLAEEDYNNLPEEYKNTTYWVEAGFCSIYAGRLLNTLQRADFVGVFGSRMVLQGAQDRVPSVVDYTNYTINRVNEVSLNKQESVISADAGTDDKEHGNYFGIYNIVNFLGALTSDVNFTDKRTTDNPSDDYKTTANGKAYGTATFLDWKEENQYKRKRNNGTCHNEVALASGVYLELVDHLATAGETDSQNPDLVYQEGDKVYGPVTGILELDLINVMKGLGGGYVYAKNIHGTPSGSLTTKHTLAHYNANAKTSYGFSYDQSSCKEYETSGNFIHNTKQIVDDCYPGSSSYTGSNGSPAHYWYIKGEIYVYDQYLSAYTGSATAYMQDIKVPLTITAGSHGKIQLTNIKPHMYAYYYSNNGSAKVKLGSSSDTQSIVVGETTYKLNDVITYWDYMQLTDDQKKLFVPETYVSTAECTAGGVDYPTGTVMLPEEFETFQAANESVYNVGTEKDVPVTDVFHLSNALTHDNGYAVTLEMTNPMVYDKWYSLGNTKIDTKTYTGQDGYLAGPTYTPKDGKSGIYGQRHYDEGDIVYGTIHDTYEDLSTERKNKLTTTQATVEPAYVATGDVEYTYGGTNKTAQSGVGISETEYKALSSDLQAKFALAYVCTSTLELASTDDSGNDKYDYIYYGDLIPASRYNELKAANSVYAQNFDVAYYCSAAGNYGGSYYEAGTDYRALDAWCSLSADDRKSFDYRYDALDLISEDYTDRMSDYKTPYSAKQKVDYTATYRGDTNISYTNNAGTSVTITPGQNLTREEYEVIPNEQYHWSNINVDKVGTYHIVKTQFTRGDVAYLVGETVDEDTYKGLNDEQRDHIEEYTFNVTGNYYFCRDSYTVGENGEGKAIATENEGTIAIGKVVPVGAIITGGSNTTGDTENMLTDDDNVYGTLVNKQLNFTIHGDSPVETTTLYVSRESDINDLSKDRVITVIYTYEYEESDDSQTHIEQISERHIINIHLQFKSGVPTIGQLQTPSIVLPSSTVGLKLPSVTPGAYEILGGGWEYYKNQADAEAHKNGRTYVNNATPMYWYQDGWYAAYYTKTYLGKTYSNAVPFSIANYHDMDKVMADTQHHMYIDNDEVKRAPKIYIDNRDCESDATKNELDLLKDLFDATNATTGTFNDDHHINACANLDFILRSDMTPKAYTNWTSIGDADHCFSGNVHGQGYTFSGLNNSLFGSLCGNVYNLGVTGSFTGAGVADTGDGWVENCWISTTGSPNGSVQAVFGNPSATDASTVQIKNCYYPSTKSYSTTGTHGVATAMPEKAFYNGEVAYNLNGFYLNKRYSDAAVTSGQDYKYYTINSSDNTQLDLHTGKYATTEYRYPDTGDEYDPLNYVERYYADGDFIYAAGTIPADDDERWYATESKYYPIYPDDYIYFGQMLTYGYVDGENYTYQQNPSRIYKQDNLRLYTTDRSNRVFRTPAYFMSKDMDLAHFNYKAVFAEKSSDATGSKEAYPNMTAIDFTANGDKDYTSGWSGICFYPPYSDYDGLKGYQSKGLTQNLLVYADKVNDATSHTILATNLIEPDMVQGTYGINKVESGNVIGHLVDLTADGYVASRNHLLVDKQNFNAPIAYKFTGENKMWYQRTPELFADGSKGWETICLPFTAETVSAHQKGEVTHFYGATKDNAIGHEYWLRGLKDVTTSGDVTTAGFVRPMTGTTDAGYDSRYESVDKDVDNTFLWDYYYSKNSRDDANSDDYQQYWNNTRSYTGYPLYSAQVPYIISFPGDNFYEFDMSGTFVPQNTYQAIAQLDAQTISFVSKTGQQIVVSDDEDRTTSAGGYNFRGFYQANDLAANEYYALDATGAQFDKGTAASKAVPFRAYFRTTSANVKAQQLFIGEDADYIETAKNDLDGSVQVYGLNGKLHIVNGLDETITVPVYMTTGQLVQNVQIATGEHKQLSVPAGVYLARGKKVIVR